MTYLVQVKQVESQTTAVVRSKAAQSELSRVVPAGCGVVWEYLRAAKAPRPGRNLALYWDGEIHLEAGVEVDQPFTGDGHVTCSSTPAGRVATAIHLGPYQRLGEAHAAILDWCVKHGHALAGPNWEVYGHWTDDTARLRTDVFYLLKDEADQGA